MQYTPIFLLNIIIITLFPYFIYRVSGSEKLDLMGETLKAIEDCITSSPAPWPDEWNKEYIKIIRKAAH
jgi:hypothetical protein